MAAGGLVHALLSDRVDIVGDVHGEIDALRALLGRLGCDPERCTVERPLVFVGDLADRGPDSVAVFQLVLRLVHAGVAQVVLGNHELNLLRGDRKEGNGWFDPDAARPDVWFDGFDHVPFRSRNASPEERRQIEAFLRTLPVALESAALRVVHAAWSPREIEAARRAVSLELFVQQPTVDPSGYDLEGAPTREALVGTAPVDYHAGLAAFHAAKQNAQPVKVLTSGRERPIPPGTTPQRLSGKWRLTERDPWWETDDDERDVVFGHYWRRKPATEIDGKPDPFAGIASAAWFGACSQAFCVDYSVGYRFKARHAGYAPGRYGLAALRWPEKWLYFDDVDGPVPTTGFVRSPS